MSDQLKRFDQVKGDTFANATKQPWECRTYAEFLASLPEDEQPAQGASEDAEGE